MAARVAGAAAQGGGALALLTYLSSLDIGIQLLFSQCVSLGGALGAILEEIDQNRGWSQLASPLGSSQNHLLDPSCSALGALLGAHGAVLGLSWASLAPS